MPKTTTPLLVEDFYKTKLSQDVNASGDVELEVATPPLNKKGFIIVNPESNSERERMYYHDVIGNIIYVKGVNRINPKEHFALDKVQINDTSLIFNYLSKSLSTTFFVEQLTSLGVKVFGGPVLKGITTISVSDTELTMTDGTINYIYYKASTNEIKSATSEVTVGTNKGIIVADITTASGIITSISYRHHGLFIGRDIESITKTNTVGLVDTYTILYSDQTTSTFNITNGSSIASIAKTATTGLVDTYTVTLTNGGTTTFEVTNGNGIEDISYTSSAGLIDTYTITFQDLTTTTFEVENGADGNGIASISKTGSAGLTDIYTIYFTNGSDSTFTVTNGSVTPLQVQNQSLISVDSTGTTNNYILNISPAITTYTSYQKFTFKANFTNTGASTVNINGLGVKSIKKYGGTEELSPGDIKIGQNVEITYDGTSFQLISIGQKVNGQNLTKSGLIAGEAMSALQVYRRGGLLLGNGQQLVANSYMAIGYDNTDYEGGQGVEIYGILTQIKLKIYRIGNPNHIINLEVYSDAGFTVLLGTSNESVTASTLTTNTAGEEKIFTFNDINVSICFFKINLISGSNSTTNYSLVKQNTTNVYSGYNSYSITNVGIITSNTSYDLYFDIIYTPEDTSKFYIAKADNTSKLNFEGIVNTSVITDATFDGSFEGIVDIGTIYMTPYYEGISNISQTDQSGPNLTTTANVQQTFTISGNHKISTISVLGTALTARTYYLRIRQGGYNGTIIGQSDNLALGNGVNTFTFSTIVDLITGVYAMEFVWVSGTTAINIDQSTGNVYAGGTLFIGGVDNGNDLYFVINLIAKITPTIGSNLFLQNNGTIGTIPGTNSVVVGKIFSDTEIELTQRINGQTSITATTGSVVLGNAVGFITQNIPGVGNVKIPYWGV